MERIKASEKWNLFNSSRAERPCVTPLLYPEPSAWCPVPSRLWTNASFIICWQRCIQDSSTYYKSTVDSWHHVVAFHQNSIMTKQLAQYIYVPISCITYLGTTSLATVSSIWHHLKPSCLKPSVAFSIPAGLCANNSVRTRKVSAAYWGAMC